MISTSAPGSAHDVPVPNPDLRTCSWWRPRTVSLVQPPSDQDTLQRQLLPKLLSAFADQGHQVLTEPVGTVHIMLASYPVADTDAPFAERIGERHMPLALTIMRDYHLSKRPEFLITFVSIRERLSSLPHLQVVEMARLTMAKIGTPKVVFVSGNQETGQLEEVTYCTMEGGHPTDRVNVVNTLRDRLVAAACARDVGNDYEIVENGIPRAAWEKTRTPEALIEAGHRMARLRLLPPPKSVGEYVSPDLARIYQHYLGMKGFSEGMLFAFDPETQAVMVTASGSWDVDKRALLREEVVPIGGLKDGKVQVWAPEGVKPKGPSVEALEMYTLLMSVPTVRLAKDASGVWRVDAEGAVTAPIIRAGVHIHVGVASVDDSLVENVHLNRQDFPYGFGCGTDLMKELAKDSGRRSHAITDASDPRAYVRWHMLDHGDTAVELWKPYVPAQPLKGLLDMFDADAVGAIRFTADHIDQI